MPYVKVDYDGGDDKIRGETVKMAAMQRELAIQNKYGLHARPAAQLVQAASRFSSEIFIEKGGVKINAKSIMGVLMLAAAQGSVLRISAEGPDAAAALDEIAGLLERKFGEE